MKLTNKALYPYLITVPIRAIGGPRAEQCGTAFFLDFSTADGKTSRWLITNKHIVEGATELHLRLHAGVKGTDGTVTVAQDSFDLVVRNPSAISTHHPSEDLCALSGGELEKGAASVQQVLAAEALREDMIRPQAELEAFGTCENVLMIGYPAGLKDDSNNLPILRRGATGSHPGMRFNNECRGLVDIASYGGSSGSPILIWNDEPSMAHELPIEARRRILLGIAVDAQYIDQDATCMINNAPTNPMVVAKVKIPLHMGKYIRAEALQILKDEIIAQGKFV